MGARLGLKGVAERMTAEEALYWPGWLYAHWPKPKQTD